MINKRYKEDALIFDIKNGGIYKSPLFYGIVDKIISDCKVINPNIENPTFIIKLKSVWVDLNRTLLSETDRGLRIHSEGEVNCYAIENPEIYHEIIKYYKVGFTYDYFKNLVTDNYVFGWNYTK